MIVTLPWLNLVNKPDDALHLYHKTFISSFYLLNTVCGMLDLQFAPGILEVPVSTTPPDLAFFKNLPAPCPKNAKNRHGINCVVMEKVR